MSIERATYQCDRCGKKAFCRCGTNWCTAMPSSWYFMRDPTGDNEDVGGLQRHLCGECTASFYDWLADGEERGKR